MESVSKNRSALLFHSAALLGLDFRTTLVVDLATTKTIILMDLEKQSYLEGTSKKIFSTYLFPFAVVLTISGAWKRCRDITVCILAIYRPFIKLVVEVAKLENISPLICNDDHMCKLAL